MMRKTWLVNLALSACTVSLILAAWRVWTAVPFPDVPPSAGGDAGFRPPAMPPPPESWAAYREIMDRNLFSPARRMPVMTEEPAPVPDKPAESPRPEVKSISIGGKTITLYGVVVTERGRRALIGDPKSENQKRDQKWVREGDTLGDLVVASIDAKKLVLREGDKLHEILLHARKERRVEPASSPSAEKPAQPKVVSTEAEKPKPRSPDSSPPAVASPHSGGARGTPDGGGDDGEYEVVKTPFGNVKRRK